jgi:hypothetical protein
LRVSILTTNFGPHPPGKLAAASAGSIIEVTASASGDQEVEGRKLELAIIDLLEKYHLIVQEFERANPSLDFDHDPKQHVDLEDVVKQICDLGKKTKWKSHFENPEVIWHITQSLGNDFATSIHCERLWYCDRNKDDKKAQAYKNNYHRPVNT